MSVFFVLVALVQMVAAPPVSLYDVYNKWQTESECREHRAEFGLAITHQFKNYPVVKITVWCQKRFEKGGDA